MDVQLNAFLSNLKAQSGYADNTQQAYASDLHQFVEFLTIRLGRKPNVTDITTQVIRKFLDGEKKSGLKPSTLHRRRVALKHFAQYLIDDGYLEGDLVEKISHWQENLWKEIAKKEVVCLSEKDVTRLLKTVGEVNSSRAVRDLAILSLMLETGLSIGVIVSINLADINMRSARVQVWFDGEKENWLSIPVTTPLIQNYLKESRPELTQSPNEDALFVSQMGGRISRQGVWQVIRNWGQQAGLKLTLSPRLLRHTAAKRMVAEGKTLDEIRRTLGHRNRFSTQALLRRLKKDCGA